MSKLKFYYFRKKSRLTKNSEEAENIFIEKNMVGEANENNMGKNGNDENTESLSNEAASLEKQKCLEEKKLDPIEVYKDEDQPRAITKTQSFINSQQFNTRSPLAPLAAVGNAIVVARESVSTQDENNLALVDDENFFIYRKHCSSLSALGENHFNRLSDEMVLHIFKWLPKKNLMRCSLVCSRFNRIVHTDSLWIRLDLGSKWLRKGALGNVISRGVVILRLAQTEIREPIFDELTSDVDWNTFQSKLQYLDLSMCAISTAALELLLSKCRKLKKLSLEHVKLNDAACFQISQNESLDSLNLTMCEGITPTGVLFIVARLKKLRSLNISWAFLSYQCFEMLIANITPEIQRLNLAGSRAAMTDQYLAALVNRCPALAELDVSDCPKLSTDGIGVLEQLKRLEYLSLSRCYTIDATAFLYVIHHKSFDFILILIFYLMFQN